MNVLAARESDIAVLRRQLDESLAFLKNLANYDAEFEGFKCGYRMCLVCKCLHPGKPKETPWRYDHLSNCPLKAEIDRLEKK